jgi:hypothetical protein
MVAVHFVLVPNGEQAEFGQTCGWRPAARTLFMATQAGRAWRFRRGGTGFPLAGIGEPDNG